MKRIALLLSLLVACGGSPPPEARTTPAASATGPALLSPPTDDPNKVGVEYVILTLGFVEKNLPAPAADVKAWADVHDNRVTVRTGIRHILIRVPDEAPDAVVAAKKKKADQILARVKKGEDFAKLAKEFSEDQGSKDVGGRYGAELLHQFGEPVRATAMTLAPGETANDLVRTPYGWHVLQRDGATDEQIAAAYKRAKAPEVLKKLADDILAKFRTPDASRAIIAAAVETVLGEDGAADPARPNALLVDRDHIDGLHMSDEAKEAIRGLTKNARPGEVLAAPVTSGHNALVVARTISPAH